MVSNFGTELVPILCSNCCTSFSLSESFDATQALSLLIVKELNNKKKGLYLQIGFSQDRVLMSAEKL